MPYRSRHRVGIVGMYKSGKTVFLTSLINHLRDHDPARLPVGDGRTRLEWLGELPPEQAFGEFPYDRNRNRMGGRMWPVDTLDVSEYRCLLRRLDGAGRGREEIELSLVDFPGERLADTVMAGRSFAEWSDTMLSHFGETAEYQAATADYLALVNGAGPVEGPALLEAYRRAMLRLITSFLPLVSPSRFLIGAHGQHAGEDAGEALVRQGISGLDADRQFAPMPHAMRMAMPEIAERFARHYDAYRSEVVAPLADWFRRCDALAVLIDVTMLLSGGVGMFNGQQQMLQHLLAYVDPGKGGAVRFIDQATRLLSAGRLDANDLLTPVNSVLHLASLGSVRFPSVSRLAFVATKLDKVHEQDRTRVDHLLRDMTRRLVRSGSRSGLRTEYFSCAAVTSTESLEHPWLEGRLETGGADAAPARFRVSAVPDHWPEGWKPLEFAFPNVVPSVPARRDAPPRQVGLDRVAGFLFDLP